jgi:hypothetical protein
MSSSSSSSASAVPAFSLRRPRYDQSSFSGRFRHFLDMVDPTTLFTSRTQLAAYQALLARAAESERASGRAQVDGVSDAELWRARKCVESMVHPDTGNVVPMPFRMAGYVPFGTPIVVGLMQPYKTLAPVAFFQWYARVHARSADDLAVCMCVSVCVCVHACMRTRGCLLACLHACMLAWTRERVYACVLVGVRVCMCARVRACVRMHAGVHARADVFACASLCGACA